MNGYEHIEQAKENYRQQLPSPKADLTSEALAQEGWPPKVQQALAFIIAHLFDSRLNVGWMKEQCEISSKSFRSVFALSMGLKPKAYILHHRIKAGKVLLKQTETTVTIIALSVGFNSSSAFCKSFKRKEGLHPLEWRSKMNGIR